MVEKKSVHKHKDCSQKRFDYWKVILYFTIVLSSLVWLDSYCVSNAFSTHKYISEQTKVLHYPSTPFTFNALKVL